MTPNLTRRSFLALGAAVPLGTALAQNKKVPVGLELYSVRNEFMKDPKGTVTAVAKMGYEVVEHWSPYFSWTVDQVKEMRKLMDDLGIRCLSTHNGPAAFNGPGIAKAIEYNKILGVKYIVMASAGNVQGADGWKRVAETATKAMEEFRSAGLRAGFHNHQTEWRRSTDSARWISWRKAPRRTSCSNSTSAPPWKSGWTPWSGSTSTRVGSTRCT